ncbi:cartilage matrix protein-like [Haliotis rufescens]|uniref:cartilage matrix protein-like n=1 Tax=Haliotis rufescens TaxID=6454 RepID=UPI00201FA281|nr:cartilage matrix protein-like [Haliotis rufescens]
MALLYTLHILTITATAIFALPTPGLNCYGRPADVVFLVDTSSSIWPFYFTNNVLPFISGVVDLFDVGPDPSQTRVGLATFSNDCHLQFHVGDFLDKEKLTDKILDISMDGGNTNTGEALTFATEEMFTADHGSRNNAAHIIVILTDGASQDYEATQLAAQNAHQKGVQVFAIGVGSQIDNKELEDIASDPDEDFKFKVTNFEALERIKGKLAAKTCEVTTLRATNAPSTTPLSTSPTPPSTTSTSTRTTSVTSTTTTVSTQEPTTAATPAPVVEEATPEPTPEPENTGFRSDEEIRNQECGGKPADVYFVLDSSGSIEKEDFSDTILDFVRSVSGLFDIGSGDSQTRVGVVTFSDDVTRIFPLSAHTSRDELLDAISPENIPHKAQGTNTGDALRFVVDEGFSPNVARPGAAHVAIVITDGQSKDTEATIAAAKAAHRAGIYVFAIGVGESVDQQELKDIASNPDTRFIFTVSDFAALSEIRNLLAIRTCEVDQPEGFINEQAACGLDDAELVFVYDSFSMGLKSTRLIYSEASRITSSLRRRVKNLSVGMISEACPSNLDITVRDSATFVRQTQHIEDIVKTKIPNLIKDVRRKWFSKTQQSGRQIMILYVDETSLENSQDLLSQTRYAKHKGIEVFVVALGEVDSKLVASIASEPHDDHVINVNNARHLNKFRNDIVEDLCGGHVKDDDFKLPLVDSQ